MSVSMDTLVNNFQLIKPSVLITCPSRQTIASFKKEKYGRILIIETLLETKASLFELSGVFHFGHIS